MSLNISATRAPLKICMYFLPSGQRCQKYVYLTIDLYSDHVKIGCIVSVKSAQKSVGQITEKVPTGCIV